MNLKEAYRYANCLDTLYDSAKTLLNTRDFITTKTETHMRNRANIDASDEVIIVKKPYDVDFQPIDVVDFIVKLIDEKEKLVDAIAIAKSKAEINIDNAITMNKKKQNFVSILNQMAGMKSKENVTQGKAYKFDINGEQKPYVYDITTVTTIDYDRNTIRNLAKKYLKETDEVSAKLDAIEINTIVDFIPQFDITSTLEELVSV